METTSSQLPVCVYCGTPRPADESSCPTCGRAWIDVRVDDEATASADARAAAGTAAVVAASTDGEPADPAADAADHTAAEADDGPAEDTNPTVPIVPPPPPSLDDTGEFSFDDWTMPPDQPRSRARWIIPIVLLIAVVAVWAFVFVDRGTSPTTTVAAATTTVPETTTTTVAETTTTTVAETTTTTEVTTTTIAVPPPGVWPPVGNPIPADDLALRAAGVGPIEIGSGIGEVAGRFTASLGEAEASGADGRCDGEAYWLQWGELRVAFDGFESGSSFVAYYYEDVGSDTALELTTLSGLALGDTVEDLTRIYASFTVAFEALDGVDVFRLIDGGELLLWGPVTSSDPDGVVEGIYSPGPCAGV